MAELGLVRMERSPFACHVRCMARASSPYEIPGTTMLSACVVHRSDGGVHAPLWGEYRRSKQPGLMLDTHEMTQAAPR